MKLEELLPNTAIRGIIPDALVTVANAQWFGSEAQKTTSEHRRYCGASWRRRPKPFTNRWTDTSCAEQRIEFPVRFASTLPDGP